MPQATAGTRDSEKKTAIARIHQAQDAPDFEAINSLAHAQGSQTLTLTGLRFDATLGILEHEKGAPQPIQVDAELRQGTQPLAPRDDDIHHVLDYRKVRQIIIDECTAEHVNLLETLIGKLCQRLLRLPGVLGVRVKITKLQIFDDCEVAIRMQAGQW
ncbi:MAG: dihydroneopterin aldolase [Pseudomonadota bacterium]|nr:dihydroneopterin aldolase [Pseudomonadota bacterium]